MKKSSCSRAVRRATDIVDIQAAINSCLTAINSSSELTDVESAAKSIKAATYLLGILAERVADL